MNCVYVWWVLHCLWRAPDCFERWPANAKSWMEAATAFLEGSRVPGLLLSKGLCLDQPRAADPSILMCLRLPRISRLPFAVPGPLSAKNSSMIIISFLHECKTGRQILLGMLTIIKQQTWHIWWQSWKFINTCWQINYGCTILLGLHSSCKPPVQEG